MNIKFAPNLACNAIVYFEYVVCEIIIFLYESKTVRPNVQLTINSTNKTINTFFSVNKSNKNKLDEQLI